jgi:hypothetical protein
MKRRVREDIVSPLKKKTSLFSIDTIYESENDNSHSNCNSASSSSVGLNLMAKEKVEISSCHNTVNFVTPLSLTEESSCTEEDEREELVSLTSISIVKPPLTALNDKQINVESTGSGALREVLNDNCEEDKQDQKNNDLRSGLVFEAGSNHYDRHSRLHKERPLRITSIMDFLKRGENAVYPRCCVLGEDNSKTSQSVTAFLNDEDYLRVHLPGYMKR